MRTNETKPWWESEFAQQISFGVMCFLVLIGMGGCEYLGALAKRTRGEFHIESKPIQIESR